MVGERLLQNWQSIDEITLLANGVIASNLLITFDLAADANGTKCKQVGALADVPVGAVLEDYTLGQNVRVIYKAGSIVPLICVDASIACGVLVYNDVAGKVSSTQGSGATLVGRTLSVTSAANRLVSVKLGLL